MLLLLLVFWWWPSETPAPAPVPPPEPPPASVVAKPVVKKPTPKKPAPASEPSPAPASQRALLRKAVEARAPDLRNCPLPPGVPTTLGTKIRVVRSGATRAVTLSTPQPLPRALSECLRQRILQWDFSDVGLSSDVEILVNFAL